MKKWINVEEIGQLYLEKILVTFDIPILFVCSNGKNKKYLCLNIGDEDGTTVIAEISKATLSAMQQNKIPMEAVYRQAIGKKLIIAKYDENSKKIISEVENSETVAANFLPQKRVKYHTYRALDISHYIIMYSIKTGNL